MKRIVYFANSFQNFVTFRKEIILDSCSYGNVVLVSPGPADSDFIIDNNVEWVCVDIPQYTTDFFKLIKAVFVLRSSLKLGRNEVVLSFTHLGNVLAAFCWSPGVLWIPNITGFGSLFSFRKFTFALLLVFYALAFRVAKKVFFQNGSDFDYFNSKSIGIRSKSCVLPGSGIDLDSAKFIDKPMSSSRLKVGFLGRITAEKGFIEFVQACKVLSDAENQRFAFFLGGDLVGSDASSMREALALYSDLGDWVGKVEDSFEFISNLDCLVVPSYREGLPRVMLEAGLVGCPVIGTNVPGVKDVLIDGYNGFICEPRSGRDIAIKIQKFASLSYSDMLVMRRNARDNVDARFSVVLVIKAYREFYE